MPRKRRRRGCLVFIDTNIFLDFYRMGGERADRQLAAIERHKDRIIRSDQVWMEFLKNRQKVILDSIGKLSQPPKVTLPPIVSGYDPARMLVQHLGSAEKKYKEVKRKVESILKDPSKNDQVYRSLNRIFSIDGNFYLSRSDRVRYAIRNRARKRFVLGYPPRKIGDTSIGDAINWEWIIECANRSEANTAIILVSRDTDYGISLGGDTILNDWLRREFRERVSRQRPIELTTRLTDALKRLDEDVSDEDVKAEEDLIVRSEKESQDRDQRVKHLITALLDAAPDSDAFKGTIFE